MVDKELLEKKKRLQKVRNILKTIRGINILNIYEKNNFALEHILKNFRQLGCYSYSKQPDSKISVDFEDSLYNWVIENMKLKEGNIYFLLCYGIWVKIQITDILIGVRDLWNNCNESCKSFVVLNENMDKLLEVGCDSRDEHNYLFDEYIIPEF